MNSAELITTSEAAERLGKSIRAVLRLCSNRTLRSRRFGARTLLVESDSLINARSVKRGRPKSPHPETRLAARLRKMGKLSLAQEVEGAFASRRANKITVPSIPATLPEDPHR